MDSQSENKHRGNPLYKGKSDSLIMRWPSLDKQLQSDIVMQRVTNRKGGGAPRQSTYNSMYQCEGEDSSTPNSVNNMISRTSSASLSLGIAGPLVFPSDHTLASIVDAGSKARREEVESDEANYETSCKSNPLKLNNIVSANDNVSINVDSKTMRPPPISLKFVDLKYKVGAEKDEVEWVRCMMSWKAKREKEVEREEESKRLILKGITGYVEAGEVLALMGPSGSGKTTLLNLLSGRLLQPQLLATTITYNDMPYSKALKPRMGFVMQDDVLYPHLTVKETLMYAALLRLPKNLSKKERKERAMEVLHELGLERCQDTIIGGPFLRGVSGGERKRVCIGQEILIDPSLLFLDEPTSGLDSTTALRIVHMMRKISRVGRTVVTTIHQPSSRIFHIFDKLILLSEGHMLYFGKASIVMDYFSSIGFSPQIAMNPADFLLDLASGNVVDTSLPSKLLDQHNKYTLTTFHGASGGVASNISSVTRQFPKMVRQYLSRAYEEAAGEKSVLLDELDMKNLIKYEQHMEGSSLQWNGTDREWNATWWSQFCVLYARGLRERRHEYLSCLRFLQVVATALIIGCLWWNSSFQTERQLADQVGLLFFIATYWGFFPLFIALFTFPLERAILAKERASDMYRLSAYFIARTLGDIPLDFLLPLLFHIIIYFMARLRSTPSAFFLTLCTILLCTIASQGLGMAIGAVMMDLKTATTLASVALLTFMLSGGFFVKSIPNFISWIRYISYNYHAFKLLVKVQYDNDQHYDCDTPLGCRKVVDSTIFHSISLDGGAMEVVILLSMIIGYRLIAYVALRHMRLVV